MLRKLMAGLSGMALAFAASAEPIRFNFTYAEPGGSATASGYIVFESTEILNPGRNELELPSPAVLDLSITIEGAESGNGTFDESDFAGLWFDTHGGTLDFSRSLMGQPTLGLPWGTPPPNEGGQDTRGADEEVSGDFNLFLGGKERSGVGYPASGTQTPTRGFDVPPNGEWYYTLVTNGGQGSTLVLTSFGPNERHAPVPSSSVWMLVLLGVVLGWAAWMHQRR